MTAGLLLGEAREALAAAGVQSPALDARILLAALMETEPGLLPARANAPVDAALCQRYRAWLSRRAGGEPVHRILGYRAFFGRQFEFGPDCLEPRPETELLVERVLADWPHEAGGKFAEIGCGSGVIAISLLCERPGLSGVASDIADGALRYTRRNAETLDVSDRLVTVRCSILADIKGPLDFVVSNPPYIRSQDVSALSREVREHDPLAALDGGPDGLDVYRAILDQAPPRLAPGGRLYLETGHDQHQAIANLATDRGWQVVSRHLDFSGHQRIAVLQAG